jgi:hypothetical protein
MQTLDALLAAVTRRALLRALRLSGGSRADAARALGLTLRTFHRTLAAHLTPAELEKEGERRGWPSRADLAAHARGARSGPSSPDEGVIEALLTDTEV